jgi:hypothetical protein
MWAESSTGDNKEKIDLTNQTMKNTAQNNKNTQE